MAPGRLAVGFGTGATARWTLGKDALTLKETGEFLRQLRGLLNGDVVQVDGEAVQGCIPVIQGVPWAVLVVLVLLVGLALLFCF